LSKYGLAPLVVSCQQLTVAIAPAEPTFAPPVIEIGDRYDAGPMLSGRVGFPTMVETAAT